MIPRRLQNRLETLTDALIEAEGVEAAFLASVLLAASDAVQGGDVAGFARRVWGANNPPPQAVPEPREAPKRPAKGRRKAG